MAAGGHKPILSLHFQIQRNFAKIADPIISKLTVFAFAFESEGGWKEQKKFYVPVESNRFPKSGKNFHPKNHRNPQFFWYTRHFLQVVRNSTNRRKLKTVKEREFRRYRQRWKVCMRETDYRNRFYRHFIFCTKIYLFRGIPLSLSLA